MKKYQFIVTIKTDYCTKQEAEDYVRNAVKQWSKGYDPRTPYFSIGDGATVKPIRRISEQN